jgi:hypothetical protein
VKAKQTKDAALEQRSTFVLLAAGIVALIVIAGGAWYFLAGGRTVTRRVERAASQGRSSFLRGAAIHEPLGRSEPRLFCDAITENLTTNLSRWPDNFVIARNTAFTYKGKNIDAKEIGKDLGVRYVLEGSVRATKTGCASTSSLSMQKAGASLGGSIRYHSGRSAADARRDRHTDRQHPWLWRCSRLRHKRAQLPPTPTPKIWPCGASGSQETPDYLVRRQKRGTVSASRGSTPIPTTSLR